MHTHGLLTSKVRMQQAAVLQRATIKLLEQRRSSLSSNGSLAIAIVKGLLSLSKRPQPHVVVPNAAGDSEMRAELAELQNAMARHGALQADLHAQLAMATEARAIAEQERLVAVSHAQHANADLQTQVVFLFECGSQFAQFGCVFL
jgi:hypothetical protein